MPCSKRSDVSEAFGIGHEVLKDVANRPLQVLSAVTCGFKDGYAGFAQHEREGAYTGMAL